MPELAGLAESPALRAAVDRLIPADDWPAGWVGGVDVYLPQALSLEPGLAESLSALVAELDAAALDRGAPDFAALEPAQQDAVLTVLSAGGTTATLVDALVRTAWEGFYAPSRGREHPAGLAMVGYSAMPGGGTPVDPAPLPTITSAQLRPRYDAVIVGSGPGAGAAAWTLTRAGRSVLLVERASLLSNSALRADHVRGKRNALYDVTVAPGAGNPRVIDDEVVVDGDGDASRYGLNAMAVGGGTRVWQGMAWRFMPEDFRMTEHYGVPEGSSLADWPIDYDELEPYYATAEQVLGVSGEEGGLTLRTPRTGGYAMPATTTEPARDLLGAAADRLGWRWGPVPLAINSVPRDGRPACVRCATCVGHACPVDAKNGSQNTFLPQALATGAAELIVEAQVIRVSDGVREARIAMMVDTATAPREVEVVADVVIVAAGAVETPRLLLASGIGNDHVGRHLHDHRIAIAVGDADRPVKTFLGPGHSIATLDHVHSDDAPWGGGVVFDLQQLLPVTAAGAAPVWGAPRWGAGHKEWMRTDRARTFGAFGIGQEIPMASSRVGIHSSVVDRWGMPAATLHKDVHWTAAEIEGAMLRHATSWLEEAGVRNVRRFGSGTATVSAAGEHSCGTMRMGLTDADSATQPDGRVRGTSRIFACDSSLHPTNGSVNPTLTIIANALRVSDLIVDGWPR